MTDLMRAALPEDPVSEGVGSLEVRWIFPGQVETAVAGWFGRFPAGMASRQNAYLPTCCSERSPAEAGRSAGVANTTPGTRISPCRGITNRYGLSATASIAVSSRPKAGLTASKTCEAISLRRHYRIR